MRGSDFKPDRDIAEILPAIMPGFWERCGKRAQWSRADDDNFWHVDESVDTVLVDERDFAASDIIRITVSGGQYHVQGYSDHESAGETASKLVCALRRLREDDL